MRTLTPYILNDLSKKMFFLSGLRQSGKTTLAKSLMPHFQNSVYFNWDTTEDRRMILKKQWSKQNQYLIFDELHKQRNWKNWIKGVFDKEKEDHSILVTGSARLDIYRRGGDSLLGRYHHWRLHPFTLSELPSSITPEEGFQRLLTLGGFPEPFLSNDEIFARR